MLKGHNINKTLYNEPVLLLQIQGTKTLKNHMKTVSLQKVAVY